MEKLKLGDSPEQIILNGNNYVKELSPQGILGILKLNKEGNVASTIAEEQKTDYMMDASMREPEDQKGSVR